MTNKLKAFKSYLITLENLQPDGGVPKAFFLLHYWSCMIGASWQLYMLNQTDSLAVSAIHVIVNQTAKRYLVNMHMTNLFFYPCSLFSSICPPNFHTFLSSPSVFSIPTASTILWQMNCWWLLDLSLAFLWYLILYPLFSLCFSLYLEYYVHDS